MTITYRLEPGDLSALLRYSLKHLPSAQRVRYAGSVVLVLASLLLTLSWDEHRVGLRVAYFCVLMLVFWGMWRFCVAVVPRIMERRSYTSDKHRSVLCEHTITLADDAIVEVTPFNEARNLWQGIYQVADDADHIYVFLTAHLAHVIPKRAFPNAESARVFYEKAVMLRAAAQPVAA